MDWSVLYPPEITPTLYQLEEYIDSPLWRKLNDYLCQTYKTEPKMAYSGCSMQEGLWKGWNIKYKKSGKSLCTVYPKQGYFLSLVPVGLREMHDAELLMPICTEYTQNLFMQTVSGHNGKSLAFDVNSENILHDIMNLIAIRTVSR